MASIRERVDLSDVPSIARGLALNFFIAGFLSLAFHGLRRALQRLMTRLGGFKLPAIGRR